MINKSVKKLAGAIAALCLSTSAMAADHHAGDSADGLPNIFEISDGDSSIYVFGTVHMLPAGTAWTRDLLKEKIASADRVFFELDMDDPQFAMNSQIAMQQRMANTSGQKLTDNLTPEETQELIALLQPLGMPPQVIDAIDPWAIMLTATVANLMQNGFDPNTGVEKTLTEYVKAASKDVEGLETIDTQLNVFESAPFEEQVAMVKSFLENREELKGTVDKMVTLWQQDKWADLADVMNDDTESAPTVSYKLLEERNLNWVVTFKELLANNETAFIAVGAGHLPGDVGVITLMEEAGYTIKQY